MSIHLAQPTRITLLLTTFVVVSAVLAGFSGLFYRSSFSPLIVLGAILATGVFIAWLAKPVWALYAALVLVFLPIGLIPPNVHSMLNRSITVIAAGVWLIRLLWDRKKIIWTGPALFMIFFLIWSGVTLLWAAKTSPALTALQVYSLRFMLFLVLIPNEIRTKRDLDGLMNALAISGWVLMLSVVETLLLQGYTAGSRLKVFGENENGAGMLAVIALVGVIWQVSQGSNHRAWKAFRAAVFVVLMFGLVAMSGSRGSAISLIITLAAFWAWKSARSWGKFAVLITILALIFTPSIFTTLVERFTVQGHDTMLGGREVLWQAAWQLIQDHPLGGVGIGNGPYASVYYLETDSRIVGAESATIHNPLLTIWSETAVLGILLYLGVFVSALFLFIREYLKFNKLGGGKLIHYFAVISCVTLGYMVSWFKGGGMESHFSYFMILALLTLPSVIDATSLEQPDQLLSPSPMGV